MGEKTVFSVPERACKDCKWYDITTSGVGICRIKPPGTHAQLVSIDKERGPQWVQYTSWPIVSSTDFCAEYSRKMQS
jgi:hypothetical protein